MDKVKEISSGSLPVITEKAFLSSADENGKPIFSRIIKLAKEKSMPIHWGTKGFSLNVDFEGIHVAICFVYPPDSVYKQTIRTTLYDRGGVERKTSVPENIIEDLKNQADKIGIFTPTGRDLKCHITRKLSENEIDDIINWCDTVERVAKNYGLKELQSKRTSLYFLKLEPDQPGTKHNSMQPVRAEYRPLPNCLRYATATLAIREPLCERQSTKTMKRKMN